MSRPKVRIFRIKIRDRSKLSSFATFQDVKSKISTGHRKRNECQPEFDILVFLAPSIEILQCCTSLQYINWTNWTSFFFQLPLTSILYTIAIITSNRMTDLNNAERSRSRGRDMACSPQSILIVILTLFASTDLIWPWRIGKHSPYC